LFDPEIFHEENVEWAISLIDSRVFTVRFRTLLIPMIDNIRLNGEAGEQARDFSKESEWVFELKSNDDYQVNDELKRNPKLTGDLLLVHHGITLDNNKYDCLSLGLTFSERKDDRLAGKRTEFFGKYFLYDRNHYDLIEECMYLDKPFDRRILFYFYTLMMDENDLAKPDPRRQHLEEDKLIVNYARENFIAMEKLNKMNITEELERFSKETNPLIKHFIKYKIQQRALLLKLTEKYENQYMMLVKDESL